MVDLSLLTDDETRELIRREIRRHGYQGAAKSLGIYYDKFLALRRKLGMPVELGNNQSRQAKWSRLRPFDVVSNLRYLAYKGSAKRRNLSFELSPKQFKVMASSPCCYCGSLECSTKRISDRSYRTKINGVDRVDNTKGYVESNCVPCCSTCNYAKHEMTLPQFKRWIKRVVEHYRRSNT